MQAVCTVFKAADAGKVLQLEKRVLELEAVHAVCDEKTGCVAEHVTKAAPASVEAASDGDTTFPVPGDHADRSDTWFGGATMYKLPKRAPMALDGATTICEVDEGTLAEHDPDDGSCSEDPSELCTVAEPSPVPVPSDGSDADEQTAEACGPCSSGGGGVDAHAALALNL